MNRLRKILFFSLFSIACSHVTVAQNDSTYQFLKTIPGSFSSFAIDNLDNVYLLTKSNQLKKINLNGDSLGVFNDVRRFGHLSYIDASNPFKILLLYSDFSTIVVLDRFLNAVNIIDLRSQNIVDVNVIATSYDNQTWVFDEGDVTLKKIDDNGNIVQRTIDFRTLFDSVPSPVQMLDRNGFVYLYDPEKGFYIFDYYGSLKNRLPFLHWTNVDASINTIEGFNDSTFYQYRLGSFDLIEKRTPSFFKSATQIKAANNKLYLLKPEGIQVYQYR